MYRIMEMWFLIMSLGKMFAVRVSTSIGFCGGVVFISEEENRANAASALLCVTCV